MKFARSTLLLAAVAFAGQAMAAVPIQPSAGTVSLQPGVQSGVRTANPAGKSKLGGSAVLPLVLLAGVAAGGIIVATKDNGHDSVSP
ncbi:hypothetical protein [Sphingomonas oryzagri]|jgi:hypothetical protein|uniref:Uncharacterized protein n=1 Tax=Sphingomonas oryzagri TaxID=3042314 RepID=A0ABT6N6Q7_9SPHN|nr:hypothetical protein [Sphingomonas oryzagri]MDH7640812.1 hypothetical protein [Sphingomonas oryzagri]